MKQPKDLVSPDELVNYIRARNVSEESATGIKLLRRAAETIAWKDDEIRRLSEQAKTAATDDNNEDPLEQIVHALGADFHEKHPEGYDLHDVLQHIDDLNVQLGGLQQGIIERDQVIEELEKPVVTGPDQGIEIKFDSSVFAEEGQSTGDTVSQADWIKDATNFAHKVHGATLVMDLTQGVRELQIYAESLIEKSPAN